MSSDNFVPENEDLYNYHCDQNILIEKPFIKYLRETDHEHEEANDPPDLTEFYAYVNSFYEFAEDFDAVNRIEHLLHEAYSNHLSKIKSKSDHQFILFDESHTTVPPNIVPKENQDFYTERKAQVAYLKSKPTCFVILGKPDLGEERLGKLLAHYWRCEFLHPEALILDEIQSGSRSGLCIEFNLRCGRAISVNVIVKLLEKRLQSESVKHRGFVLCGFPLIRNDLFTEDPVSSESAIFKVHEIFDEVFDAATEVVDSVKNVSRTSLIASEERESVPESEEEFRKGVEAVKVIMPPPLAPPPSRMLNPIIKPSADFGLVKEVATGLDIKGNYLEDESNQLDYILSLCEDFDYFIIYLKCHNDEVVNIRKDIRCDSQTLEMVSIERERSDNIMFTLYSMYPQFNEGYITDDVIIHNRKMLALQRDFPGQVGDQLNRYMYDPQLTIEKYILLHDPDKIIKLDGRMAPHKMFQTLRMRLKVLPVSQAIIPEKLVDLEKVEEVIGERKLIRPETNFDDYTLEQSYIILRNKNIAGPLYPWALSEWGFKCPVNMKLGLLIDGNPKYAVKFMNKIFFLADEDACERFLRNPRPYLLPPMPKAYRKVFIIGPEHSGKSLLSRVVQQFLDSEVIDVEYEVETFKLNKVRELIEIARMEATRKAIEELLEKRKQAHLKAEAERQHRLNVFLVSLKDHLRFLLREFRRSSGDSESYDFETDYESTSASYTSEELAEADEIIAGLEDLTTVLDISTVEDCERILQDESALIRVAPEELQPPKFFAFDLISESHISVVESVTGAVKDIKSQPGLKLLNPDEVQECIVNIISKANEDLDNHEISGWILNGFPVDTKFLELLDESLYPDLVIFLSSGSTENDQKTYFESLNVISDRKDDTLKQICTKQGLSLTLLGNKIHKPIYDRVSSESDNGSEIGYASSEYAINVLDIKAFLEEHHLEFLEADMTNKTVTNVFNEVCENLKKRCEQSARIVGFEERQRELRDYGDLEVEGEFPGEDEGERLDREKHFRENRRLGDANEFDAVALQKHNVLWRGKEIYQAKYMNNIWLFANEDNLKEFVKNPFGYTFFNGPRKTIPPLRICIVGNNKIGKTTQAKLLSETLGLSYFDFDKELKNLVSEEVYDGYVNQGESLDDAVLYQMLMPYYLSSHFKKPGVVIDGFPKRPSDILFMARNHAIPDFIVELTMGTMELRERILDILLKEWSVQMEKEKAAEMESYQLQMALWHYKRDQRRKELLETAKSERYGFKLFPEEEDTIFEGSKTKLTKIDEVLDEEEENFGGEEGSLLSLKSYQDAQDEKQILQILNEEFSEPILNENWETPELARERLQIAIDSSILSEPQRLIRLKTACESENLPWITIQASLGISRVFNAILKKSVPLKLRNSSIFERVYDISSEMAEKLLEVGYFFLSRFGRTCPVQMYEKHNPLQMYLPRESLFQVFPMIHRNYIYFISGLEARDKFKEDILKYVNQNYTNLPMLKPRVAVIGPPRSGKTSLAERLHREFGFEHISIGRAARYVLKYLPSSLLAKSVKECLLNGHELTEYLAMQCVESLALDAKAVATGIVMDGFPNSIHEMKILARLNLLPHLIIDVQASLDYILSYMDIFGSTHRPGYSKKFITHRFEEWSETSEEFRKWADKEYQNLAKIGVGCKWKCWKDVEELTLTVFSGIKDYYKNKSKDMALSVANLLVTPYEFLMRQSQFENFCPICLYYHNSLTSGGQPPDRTGMVLYHGRFYWLCQEHINEFLINPDKFLGPNVKHSLPLILPQKVVLESMPENVFYEGHCVVCLKENRPLMVLNPGLLDLAIKYGDTYYLFDSQKCFDSFYHKPHKLASTSISFPQAGFAPVDFQSLPTLGMLEQYTSKILVNGLIDLNNVRPLFPGLDIKQSALVHLGLYLKINNPQTSDSDVELYKACLEQYMNKRGNLVDALDDLKATINPYLHYQEPLGPYQIDLGHTLHLKRVSTTETLRTREVLDSILDHIDYSSNVQIDDDSRSYFIQ